jgi:DNA adenine methylase
MTAYQGGKGRLGERIYNVIKLVENDIVKDNILPYFEPFVGMGGVMRHFANENDRELYASDLNKDLILMWKALQKGWKPPLSCSLKEYNRLKDSPSSAKRAFIGIVASYGTVFFNGYRLNYTDKKDYLREGYNSLMKVVPMMKNVDFMKSTSYDEWDPKGYLIYCDPPYINNKLKSKYFQKFDHNYFWDVMRKWSKNNIVIISETMAPNDFKEIWCAKSNCNTRYKNKEYKDCLFVHNDIYNKLNPKLKKYLKSL